MNAKKRIPAILALLGLLLPLPALAQQAPTFIPVQGTLTEDDGTAKDGAFALVFRLYAEEMGGDAFYAERQDVVVEDGLFTAYLGDGTPADLGGGATSPALDLGVFANRPMGVTFLGITIDENPELAPRLQLGSVPFAAHAQTCGDANTLGGKKAANFAALSGGKLNASVLPEAYAKASHKHGAGDLPDLNELNGALPASKLTGKITAGQLADTYTKSGHTHSASQITGKLSASQLPSGGYLERGRFAWGRKEVPSATSGNSGSILDPNGANNAQGGPAKGEVTVSVPDVGCSDPFVWVSPNTNGDWNFISANVRHYTLVGDGTASFEIRWINVYQEEGYTLSFDWLVFCD